MKKYLILLFLLISVSSFAGVVLPIPIYMGGSLTNNQGLALLIACDVVSLTIYTVLSITWLVNRRGNYSYFKSVIYSDLDSIFVDVHTLFFLIVNAIGLICAIAIYIEKLL
jgi:hypothetical protein